MNLDSGLKPPEAFRWLYIDFNSYFASVEQQLEPRLRGRPIAVVPVETDGTCAIAASYEAKAFGVKTGTMIHEAKRLCPGLICVLARHEEYIDFHERILREIDRHIPVTKVCSIDEMACKLMGSEAEENRLAGLAARIKAGLAENIGPYVRCSIGVSSNRYLAKVATDLKKPDGFTLLPPSGIGRLMELKLRDFPGIGANMEKRLNIAGIWDVKSLYNYGPKHLRAVWGSLWGERMWYLLRGYDLAEEETTRGSIGHSHVLPPEMRPPPAARQIAHRLTLKAAARLRRMEYYAGVFVLSLRLEDGERFALEARFAPARDSFRFLEVMEAQWAELMREVKARRIKKVGVTLLGLTPPGALQADLFDTVTAEAAASRAKCEKISDAVDKINKKFGRDTVLLGLTPGQGKSFSGTKIAFTRIPDIAEFVE